MDTNSKLKCVVGKRSFSALLRRSPFNVALPRLTPAPCRTKKSLMPLDALKFSISILLVGRAQAQTQADQLLLDLLQ